MAFRDVFQQTQIGFIENEISLPRAPLPGELSSGCETERLDKGRLSSERNNAGAALYNLSVIIASLDAASPVRRGFGSPFCFQADSIGFIENEISLPRAPLIEKTPPAGGGGTQVPKGERLSPQAAEGFYYIL